MSGAFKNLRKSAFRHAPAKGGSTFSGAGTVVFNLGVVITTIKEYTTHFLITVETADGAARYRLDGVNPTADADGGMRFASRTTELWTREKILNSRFTGVGASTLSIQVREVII